MALSVTLFCVTVDDAILPLRDAAQKQWHQLQGYHAFCAAFSGNRLQSRAALLT
jgi:hypothetical protein